MKVRYAIAGLGFYTVSYDVIITHGRGMLEQYRFQDFNVLVALMTGVRERRNGRRDIIRTRKGNFDVRRIYLSVNLDQGERRVRMAISLDTIRSAEDYRKYLQFVQQALSNAVLGTITPGASKGYRPVDDPDFNLESYSGFELRVGKKILVDEGFCYVLREDLSVDNWARQRILVSLKGF